MRRKRISLLAIIIGVSLIIGILGVGFGPVMANNISKRILTPRAFPFNDPLIADEFTQPIQTPEVFPVNENGQTYGSSAFGEPDLVAAVGVDGTHGYVLAIDVNGPMPKTPEEAIAHNKKLKPERFIPLYDVDGKTVIGEFKIVNGGITETPAEQLK